MEVDIRWALWAASLPLFPPAPEVLATPSKCYVFFGLSLGFPIYGTSGSRKPASEFLLVDSDLLVRLCEYNM